MVARAWFDTLENDMSKLQTLKPRALVVRRVTLSAKGDAVKVTKLELTKEGAELLRSQSQGIRLKRDSRAEPQDARLQANPA